jgi:hypothetical protein
MPYSRDVDKLLMLQESACDMQHRVYTPHQKRTHRMRSNQICATFLPSIPAHLSSKISQGIQSRKPPVAVVYAQQNKQIGFLCLNPFLTHLELQAPRSRLCMDSMTAMKHDARYPEILGSIPYL